MCGIFGSISNSPTPSQSVSARLSWIKRRGPDGDGYFEKCFGGHRVSLIHSRLSIIDLSNYGSQPMALPNDTWVIIYNGEIYNYVEIRDELLSLGCRFESRSDTEVLLKAWAQWGLDALRRLNGMFAFAVFNQLTGEIWLVRDRFGVKPLVWGQTPDKSFIFSSSVASVAHALGAPVDIDYCSRGLRYKSFEGMNDRTPFEGVKNVPAGGWIKVQLVQSVTGELRSPTITQGRWYDLKSAVRLKMDAVSCVSADELLMECKDTLVSAVTLRLRSDVPLAISLSGGLDSSAVAAFAARQVQKLRGFTYGTPNALYSEGPTVSRFSRETDVAVHYVWPTLDASGFSALLERTFISQEAPFPGLSIMAQNEVFRAVSGAGFKVVLGGQGGDESFAGYRKFFVVALRHALLRREAWESVQLLYSLAIMLLFEAGSAKTYWKALSRYSGSITPAFRLLNWSPEATSMWGATGASLSDRQIEDVEKWSIPTLLRYEDRNSMGYGVESRLPFMDYRLVELALALPASLKISHGFGKWALRQMTDGIVPNFIRLNRKKRGFDVTQSWIEDGLGASLRERIFANRVMLSPYIKTGVDLTQRLSDAALRHDTNLLDEALMLAWLAQPVRPPSGWAKVA